MNRAREMANTLPPAAFAQHPLGLTFMDWYYPWSPQDSDLWIWLLPRAYDRHPELASILEYLRTAGTILVPDPAYGFKLQPLIGPNGWESKEKFQKECETYLTPYMQMLCDLLNYLRREYNNGLIGWPNNKEVKPHGN